MLTNYPVRCPYEGCGWRGTLFPLDSAVVCRTAQPTNRTISFECPKCRRDWKARVVGEDAVNLPLKQQPVAQA